MDRLKDLLNSYLEDQQLRGHAFPPSGLRPSEPAPGWLGAKNVSLIPANQTGKISFTYLRLLRLDGNKTATLKKIFSNLVFFYEFLEEARMSQATEGLRKIQKNYLCAYKSDGEETAHQHPPGCRYDSHYLQHQGPGNANAAI